MHELAEPGPLAEAPRQGDEYTDAIDAVAAAADHLRLSLDAMVALLARARRQRLAGSSVTDVLHGLLSDGGKEARLAPTLAFKAFEQSVTAFRARGIRMLVDDEGMTFTEVARLTGVSRQMVARLYASVGDGPTGTPPVREAP